MKHFFLLILICLSFSQAAGQVPQSQSISQLATKYYQSRDFEKAAPLFRDLFASSGNGYYFRLYIQSLIELQQFENADNEIKKEIRRAKLPQSELLIQQGFILKMQKRQEESQEKYNEALRQIIPNRNSVVSTASNFMQWREYEMAEKVYIAGRKILPAETFNNELAQIYLYLRNYERMTEELLDMARKSEEQLPLVESLLSSALYSDIDEGFKEEFRGIILKRIQAEPTVIAYNRLLIWFFIQEKQFTAALRQAVALDRRTRQEDLQILNLAQMAINNHNYSDASEAYNYVISKGKDNPVWPIASYQKLHADYSNFIFNGGGSEEAAVLALQFEQGLEILGYNLQNIALIREFAHLLSFYLRDSDKAITVLQKGLQLPMLKPLQIGELKAEMADVYVYAGDPYEATLLYSQVIDANRDNTLGDDVKLKKAKLAYYLGNFDYAKAQLDVLKASTSKLTANDAMELALFISDNSVMDTTFLPLKYFSEADLFFFRNEDDLAVQKLDSISVLFPQNSLYDDILFRKAKIANRKNNYQDVVLYLDRIVKEFEGELLCDDALYMLAETWHYRMNDTQKAAELYKKILFDYPGSIYVTESRNRFRELTGNAPVEQAVPDQENEKSFINGKTGPGN